MSLTKKIIIALILGVVVGIGFSFAPDYLFSAANTYVLDPVGQIFLNLIMMIVVPIVFVSIVLGTAGLGEPAKLGKIGVQTISFFLVTTAIALTVMCEKTNRIFRLFEQANDVLIYIVDAVMKTAPYGAFALIASAIGNSGIEALGSMAMYMVSVVLALILHAAITYSLAI